MAYSADWVFADLSCSRHGAGTPPPYSLYVSDYYSLSREKMVITLPRLTLESGVPLRISGEDLLPFLSRENLTGYLSQGRLPEGPTTFSVEVFEAYTRHPVSGKANAMAWLSFSKPPQLNLPANNETIVFRDPTTILFSGCRSTAALHRSIMNSPSKNCRWATT